MQNIFVDDLEFNFTEKDIENFRKTKEQETKTLVCSIKVKVKNKNIQN